MWKLIFIPAAIILAVLGTYFDHQNAHTAQRQADAIIAADNAGQDTTASLAGLKNYIKTHSGAQVGFTLTAGYERAQAAARVAAQASASNAQVYAQAQAACSGKTDSITQAKCNEQYLAAHLQNVPQPAPVAAPKSSDFQYDWSSPFWVPDLAGACLLGAVLAAIAAVAGYVMQQRKKF